MTDNTIPDYEERHGLIRLRVDLNTTGMPRTSHRRGQPEIGAIVLHAVNGGVLNPVREGGRTRSLRPSDRIWMTVPASEETYGLGPDLDDWVRQVYEAYLRRNGRRLPE